MFSPFDIQYVQLDFFSLRGHKHDHHQASWESSRITDLNRATGAAKSPLRHIQMHDDWLPVYWHAKLLGSVLIRHRNVNPRLQLKLLLYGASCSISYYTYNNHLERS